jgi:hypothetical protein
MAQRILAVWRSGDGMAEIGISMIGKAHGSPVNTDHLCGTCRHYRPSQEPAYRWAQCAVGAEIDPITGATISDRVYAVRGVFGQCGPDGKLWEASAVRDRAP